jgi:hypothetical protein
MFIGTILFHINFLSDFQGMPMSSCLEIQCVREAYVIFIWAYQVSNCFERQIICDRIKNSIIIRIFTPNLWYNHENLS